MNTNLNYTAEKLPETLNNFGVYPANSVIILVIIILGAIIIKALLSGDDEK